MEDRATFATFDIVKWRNGNYQQTQDKIAEEVPIAFVYNGISHAVMLATPSDLEDFALGFSLTEGILGNAKELYSCDVTPEASGIRVELEIASERLWVLKEKRRSLAGRTGCGLCGTETLSQAIRMPPPVNSEAQFDITTLHAAFAQMAQQQVLQQATGATHAAAWLTKEGELMLLREDVGRHNALDKLIGALSRKNIQTASGCIIVTSRASYEMVQKTASAGIGLLAAISAPTALAVRIARSTGLTLVGFVRNNGHVVYAHPERIRP